MCIVIASMVASVLSLVGCRELERAERRSKPPDPTLLTHKLDRQLFGDDVVHLRIRNNGGDGMVLVEIHDTWQGRDDWYRTKRHFKMDEEAWVTIKTGHLTANKWDLTLRPETYR